MLDARTLAHGRYYAGLFSGGRGSPDMIQATELAESHQYAQDTHSLGWEAVGWLAGYVDDMLTSSQYL